VKPLLVRTIVAAALILARLDGVSAEPVTADQFREQLLGLPLCGVPVSGPLIGKALCTVHFPDGTAVVAGSGVLVRGLWELDGNRLCRRGADDPLERRRCVDYERLGPDRYRNSDGVEICIGPCP
jgi:hypothetical protein